MPSSVILVTTYDPTYLAIAEHLARTETAAGNAAFVLDLTLLLAAPVDSYHRSVLRAFRIDYPGRELRRRIVAAGAEYVEVSPPGDESSLSDTHEEALALAVRSAIITFFRTDKPDPRRRSVANVIAGLQTEGHTVFHAVAEFCARHPDLARAYVPNGRFPHQRLASLALTDAGITTLHFERGTGAGRAYVQGYSPHDRFRSQGSVDSVLADLGDEEVEQIADAWLSRRAPGLAGNEYSTLWNDDVPGTVAEWVASGAKIAGFFSSSQDEFEFQGPEWQLHEWADQFDAFDAMLTKLESDGYRCYLRVHPNLATRAHDYFLRERDGIRRLMRSHPGMVVIWHDDPTNSYRLLDVSDVVVTWASTIGLEASARGIPVWAGAVTYFGLVADVREVLSPAALERDGLTPWTVDPRGAKRFIAYMVGRDQELTTEATDWIPWRDGRRPFGATLAHLAVSGGTPGVGTAIWSQVDVYRHRSVAANLRARRRR